MTTDILTHSALYQELKDLQGVPDTAEITGNPVINTLATEGPDTSELFRYTRAVQRGHIHAALQEFSKEELSAAKEPLDFWQLPISWVGAIDEEIAFKEFQQTGVLPPLLAAKAEEITRHFLGYTSKKNCVFVASGTKFELLMGRRKGAVDSLLLGQAARSGHLELVQWIFEECTITGTSEYVCAEAVISGNIKILQYLRALDIPWDCRVCSWAAYNKHWHILQWAHENGASWDKDTTENIAKSGNLNMLKWVHERGCPWDKWLCAEAAKKGHLHILQWARENGCPWNEYVYISAIQKGQLHIIHWAYENGCPWSEKTLYEVAINGDLEVLKWFYANGCPWDEWVCKAAAIKGDLQMLKWVREKGCPWNYHVIKEAKKHAHTHIVEWALANGCPTE